MMEEGVVILNKTKEIINYFNPSYWFMENPQSGKMKEFNNELPFYDIDYCKYGFDYKKRTRIWTNVKNFNAKLCNKDCDAIIDGRHKKDVSKDFGGGTNRDMRYRIPPLLIEELFECILKDI